uniref:Uncharacterized protein n=1 Tax=Ditylenchus dipsaci TaxID=166011 RepID=A0A915EIA6_9BILA
MRSVEEEHQECVSALTVISSKKKNQKNDQELRTAQRNNFINLQEVFGDDMEEDAGPNFYDIDISPRQLRSASPVDGRV